MTNSKFFNNKGENTLFEKLKGISEAMLNFNQFLAVVGYFRSTGYFKLRKELNNVKKIRILVGINIDDIFRKHNKAMLMLNNKEKAKEIYENHFRQDLLYARYTPEVEDGIRQMCEDLMSGKLEMRIHATKNLHAKFYLCLPDNHNENTDGWVIMGSSNISDSGLGIAQTPRYELNVAMKDFNDVDYCHKEFDTLWEEGELITVDDIDAYKKETYLGYQPTPYELYIRVLIELFGDLMEDDFRIEMPEGVKDLKYQKDAVIQGYQMLMRHNGLILADVVGLGKTMIATMIAKRFIEANGKNTNLLVVFPPSLKENWVSTFKQFGISKKAQFVSNGSLSKVLEGKEQYKDKEDFDMVIVDESHGFRNDDSGKYDQLQRICKSPCNNDGLLHCKQKKMILLSATPLNNRPEDFQHQLLLFQDSQCCTIDGIPNLDNFFAPLNSKYKRLMQKRGENKENDGENAEITSKVDEIYEQIRKEVIDKVTIRRTRTNILNNPDYKKDLEEQNVKFPHIEPPKSYEYKMSTETSTRFYFTLSVLSNLNDDDENENQVPHLNYARYRAVEFLKPEKKTRYKNAEHIGQSLAGLFRVHMVKRLESSFHAFKISLKTLLKITEEMIKMFDENKVLIIPDVDVKGMLDKGMELDQIIEYAIRRRGYEMNEIVYNAEDFMEPFLPMLENDREVLLKLNEEWDKEDQDPKFEEFVNRLSSEILDKKNNSTGKLVLFSESVDTLDYLYEKFKNELYREDVLEITSLNVSVNQQKIFENFDANYPSQKNEYNIILTSDVLAEGINLHRSNVIVNYDTPWNSTKLMQRIGRVNRIGSVADSIRNYLFYPSKEGDKEIQLYKNALIKLQSFHSALGEDSQIYTTEEIVKQFELFDSSIEDNVDKTIKLLRELRDVYNNDRKLYNKIKALPMKSRVMRDTGKNSNSSVVYVASNVKTEFYQMKSDLDSNGESNISCKPIDLFSAIEILRADRTEQAISMTDNSFHYDHVNEALKQYTEEYVKVADNNSINNINKNNVPTKTAIKSLRMVMQLCEDSQLKTTCQKLIETINHGVYAQLTSNVNSLLKQYNNENRMNLKNDKVEIKGKLNELLQKYGLQNINERSDSKVVSDPRVIISESFK